MNETFENVWDTHEEKTAFNLRAKAEMRDYLRSKSWVEKVEAMRRMNVMSKLARESMRRAIAAESAAHSG